MRQKRNWQVSGLAGVVLCGLWFSPACQANVPITITATIIEPACSVTDMTGNSRTEVDFESVQVDDVYAGTVRQPLPVKVTCDGRAPTGKTLKMSLTPVAGGTMAYAGRTVLGTSVPGLGIAVTDRDDNPVTPETWVPVSGVTGVDTPAGTVDLQATLVSEKTTADLKAGAFTASASLVMAYQ
ncbi:fimbrial protein [Salmonella enterica subsp. enterica serovar Muenchen]|nr:fimbrial protein [Salmonella enterica subsp. enterica serovar Muenchen]EDQ9741382.1 fimbrial protein [Salmonella enterica subsp. enterica serovar Oranienburg]EEO7308630.1 fimbrial protein [Salmonella enterica]ECZ5457908.1 fimbrial protein [Salmonella enterica subsp. enterica serovar Muenchen]EDG8467533.1 fimbrial protein [Salmonella enterica subsp. enterica serovar Muenchen]